MTAHSREFLLARQREYSRRAYQKHRDARRAAHAEWYEKNKASVNARSKTWKAANIAEVQERDRKARRRRHGIVDPTGERRSGPCEICDAPADPLHLDHDHATGRARGWLCFRCNSMLGLARDSGEILKRAGAYLVAYK